MKKSRGRWSVWKVSSKAARFHTLETERKGTFNLTIFHCTVGLVKRGRSGGAIVVHVDDGYVSEAEVVEGTLEYA